MMKDCILYIKIRFIESMLKRNKIELISYLAWLNIYLNS